jgi:adenine-specific DNA methylase
VTPTFIETQFPIARLSAEAYKERKGASSQTLPKLGKWWGRKPLVLVRATILGMLMPASSDPKTDRDIFLKVLTMDDTGLWERCKPSIKRKLNRPAFDALSYAERISNCERPENIAGPTETTWTEINTHLATTATNLPELITQLGQRNFGHTPRVGDSFCGGGSIPFEASRIGCDVFASDLNPVAALLTWASLNVLGGSESVQEDVRRIQRAAFAATDRQITEWGIEHNIRGERAEVFLYCVEVKPEGCDYYIPLAPSWVIAEKYRIVTTWRRVPGSDRLRPEVSPVEAHEFELYKKKKGATVVDGRVVDPFNIGRSWSIEGLRGPEGLRRWTNDDVVPRPGDVFQERLYCIRWTDTSGKRRYAAPDDADIAREAKVLALLSERITEWKREGFMPSKAIVSGYNTEQPIRERGWTYWHHLFMPRQLLLHGTLLEMHGKMAEATRLELVTASISIGACADFNSKLCRWIPHLAASGGIGVCAQTFYNQALNTLFNWGARALPGLDNFGGFSYLRAMHFGTTSKSVGAFDARDVSDSCDIWITDPPYADAVNYHELGDFFLAWYEKQLDNAFPEWIVDARAELAVRGDGEAFRRSMVEIYKNLTRHMPDDGLQVVMFTHQDPGVWADLGMILWAAGLKATAAWTISTETEAAGLKQGNFVQGTVCLVLRKRIGNEPGFLDEVYPLVEDEVKRQIASMRVLDGAGEPNFNDADYQLAAYAAALRVLTQYGNLDGRDVEHEVFAIRVKNDTSAFQAVIERALGIACETLVPLGLENSWRELSLVERYYLRALDIESRGERRQGMYEELARGFGVTDIRPLLKNDKANGARVHTPSGFATIGLAAVGGDATGTLPSLRGRGRVSAATHPFASSSLRHLLFAIRETAATDNSPETGRRYLRETFGQAYWGKREGFVRLLDWLAALSNAKGMNEWVDDSEAARILAGRLRNDHA